MAVVEFEILHLHWLEERRKTVMKLVCPVAGPKFEL